MLNRPVTLSIAGDSADRCTGPQGMTVIMYAPPGASMDDRLDGLHDVITA
jgi:hypothetical protein